MDWCMGFDTWIGAWVFDHVSSCGRFGYGFRWSGLRSFVVSFQKKLIICDRKSLQWFLVNFLLGSKYEVKTHYAHSKRNWEQSMA